MQFWRDALTKFENEVNSLANSALKSPDAARNAQTLSSVALSLQQFSDKAMSDHLRRLNIPSRKEVMDLGDALTRLESKIDQILTHLIPPSDLGTPRPARTRRPTSPPPEAGAVQAVPPPSEPTEAANAPAEAAPVPTRAREAAETVRAKPRAAKAAPTEGRRSARASKG